MKTEIREKRDNVVTNLKYTTELAEMIKQELIEDEKCEDGQYHLCWNCKNGCPSKCRKVANRIKKNIEDYPFINSGYQIVDNHGEVMRFIVTKCENFDKDENTPKQASEIARLKLAKEKMKALYFGAESKDEADVIQHELARRNLIYGIRGKKLNDRQYEVVKRLVREKQKENYEAFIR